MLSPLPGLRCDRIDVARCDEGAGTTQFDDGRVHGRSTAAQSDHDELDV